MSELDYRQMLEQVKAAIAVKREELGACFEKAEALEDEIAGLQQTAAGLAKTLREQYVAEDELGLTDAIRRAFKQNEGKSFTALEVRDELENMGYDTSKYGNVMASIHAVMNRLAGKEIKQSGTRANNKPCYMWIPKMPVNFVPINTPATSLKKNK